MAGTATVGKKTSRVSESPTSSAKKPSPLRATIQQKRSTTPREEVERVVAHVAGGGEAAEVAGELGQEGADVESRRR